MCLLQLCLKDRDLIAGLPFEHQAVTELITNRCRFVVPIFSPNFLNSEDNKFFVNFTEALGIGNLYKLNQSNWPCPKKKPWNLRKGLPQSCSLCLPELQSAKICQLLFSSWLHQKKSILGFLGQNEKIARKPKLLFEFRVILFSQIPHFDCFSFCYLISGKSSKQTWKWKIML